MEETYKLNTGNSYYLCLTVFLIKRLEDTAVTSTHSSIHKNRPMRELPLEETFARRFFPVTAPFGRKQDFKEISEISSNNFKESTGKFLNRYF